jgi:acetyltransferase
MGFEPRGVAVLGASRDPAKFGHWTVDILQRAGFSGQVYPVNPGTEAILGLKCWPDVREIPGPVDLACICQPAPKVRPLLEACVAKQVPLVAIFSSGFAEIGPEGRKAEAELVRTVRHSSTRIIGPNSLGLINTANRLIASFGREIVQRDHPPGEVAFLTQSGAFGQALYCWAQDMNLGLSKFISTGNEADLTCPDYLEYLAQDTGTRAIMMYLEGLQHGRRFIEVASRAVAEKPILVLKVGRSRAGRRAAASHTGALAGEDQVYSAAFRQAGVIRVVDPEDMFDAARALVRQPPLAGNRIAIVTSSGGIGVQTADACEDMGLEVPVLGEGVFGEAGRELPAFAAVANPVDLTSQVHLNPQWFAQVVRALGECPEVDGIIVGVSAFRQTEIARQIAAGSEGASKPVLVSWTIGSAAREAIAELEAHGVPVYPTPDRAARAMGRLWQYARFRRRQRERLAADRLCERGDAS